MKKNMDYLTDDSLAFVNQGLQAVREKLRKELPESVVILIQMGETIPVRVYPETTLLEEYLEEEVEELFPLSREDVGKPIAELLPLKEDAVSVLSQVSHLSVQAKLLLTGAVEELYQEAKSWHIDYEHAREWLEENSSLQNLACAKAMAEQEVEWELA